MSSNVSEPNYTREQVVALYELGRMYFEMGYFTPAERIFNGLAVIDEQGVPARIALGLLKLERGLHAEASGHFRASLQAKMYPLQAKLGLCFAFLAAGEKSRVRSVLEEIVKTSVIDHTVDPEVRTLFYSLVELFEGEAPRSQ